MLLAYLIPAPPLPAQIFEEKTPLETPTLSSTLWPDKVTLSVNLPDLPTFSPTEPPSALGLLGKMDPHPYWGAGISDFS